MKKIALILVVFLCAGTIFAAELPKIAVYVVGDIPETQKRVLTARMLNALIRNGRHINAEHAGAFLTAIENELAELSDNVMNDIQISRLAQQFDIEFVFIAELTQIFSEYNIFARIIDTETATIVSVGEAHSPLQTMNDIAQLTDDLIQDMFGRQRRAESQPEHVPIAVAPPPPSPAPVAVAPLPPPALVSAPLPTPVALRIGTSMADRAKAAAAEKIIETVMSQITPQIRRMVASAPVSAEVKADAEQRLTITARNLVTTMLNDGMSGKMPNPQALLTQVLGEMKSLARELLGTISIDVDVSGGGTMSGQAGNSFQNLKAKTRIGLRGAVNMSNANVDVYDTRGYADKNYSDEPGWELGLVTCTRLSRLLYFNSGANLIFRTPVKHYDFEIKQTALAIPAIFRLGGAVFAETGLQLDFVPWTLNDNNYNIAPVNLGFVSGFGFGLMGGHIEVGGKLIWGMNDFANIETQKGNKLLQANLGLTAMLKERPREDNIDYIVIKHQFPAALILETGWFLGNEWFWGFEFGAGLDRLDSHGSGGLSLNLGGVYDLHTNLQFVYGGSIGAWLSVYPVEVYYQNEDKWGFAGPFIKLRYQEIELSYKGLMGVKSRWEFGNRYDKFGVINQFTVGYYHTISNRKQRLWKR